MRIQIVIVVTIIKGMNTMEREKEEELVDLRILKCRLLDRLFNTTFQLKSLEGHVHKLEEENMNLKQELAHLKRLYVTIKGQK